MFGKKKKDNKLNVEIVTVNKGQPTEHYQLAAVEMDGKKKTRRVLSAAPNWKTKAGAVRWAEKNGYNLVGANKPAAPKAPKTATSKPAGKRSAPKPAETNKSLTAANKPTVAKNDVPDIKLMHSDKDEINVDGVKPVLLNLGNAKQKPTPKVLRKVGKKGGYTVFDKLAGKTFETEKEAKDYALNLLKTTGVMAPIRATDRQVTHSFLPENEAKNKR